MGIGSNLMVEIAEQEHREALFEAAIQHAAIAVALDRAPRESAYEAAKDFIEEQKEAVANGELEGITLPAIPKGKEAQVKAIARALYEKFE